MNREYLKELGLTDEQIEATMAEHGKAIQAVKPADYDALKTEKETLSQQIVALNNSLTTAAEEKAAIEKEKETLMSENTGYKQKELKGRIAHEFNIPFELASRLSGETEEEIKADAKSLAELIVVKPTLPLGSTEPDNVGEQLYSNQARILEEQFKSE